MAASIGWKHGGGGIPIAIVCGTIIATWIGLTRTASPAAKEAAKPPPDAPNAPRYIGPESEQAFYETVAGELDSQQLSPGTWARAYADASGAPDQARALYIRYRVGQLEQARNEQQKAELLATIQVTKSRALSGFQQFVYTLLTIMSALLTIVLTLGIIITLIEPSGERIVLAFLLAAFAFLFGLVTHKCHKATQR